VIPNWADGRAIQPLAHEDNPFRREHDLKGRFVAMYSGNLGEGHDAATLIGAARILEAKRPEVLFLFIGDGSRRAEAERLARGLKNVRFLPYQPYEGLRQSLSAADVHLISLREGLDGLLVPSKLYGALASGRPIMYVGPSACEVARVTREHDVGWEGRPGDAAGLAGAIEAAAASPAWSRERGARARAIFEAEFDRPIAVERWRRVLAEAANAPFV
jgi:colanic acid biosynthesis glycosyl transferase WcaI